MKFASIVYCLFLTIFISFSNLVSADIDLDKKARSSSAIFKSLPDNMFVEGDVPSEEKIELGKKLYFETDLSLKKDLSCNSCHQLNKFGVDNESTSPGVDGKRGGRNSPSSFNAALHIAQFWDGRAKDVEEQALGPILNPIEMAMPNEEEVIKRLKARHEYVDLFKKVFPKDADPLNYKNIGKAIGAFERTLVTPSRFDTYLKGDEKALTDQEKRGLVRFVETGCIVCHSGVGLGGSMYQKLGLVKPYSTKDMGRFEHTKNESDKYFFKVPSLRNIEKTGPYFHDGSIKSLDQAIKIMSEYQLGKVLSDSEAEEIKVFLKSLTGELKKE